MLPLALYALALGTFALGTTELVIVGLPKGMSVDMNPALFLIDVVAVPLCALGALLALSLIRPWGRLFPRRLLLACWSAPSPSAAPNPAALPGAARTTG